VTFKKNGFRWWTVFVEKYGGAFLYGKYPNNAGSQFKAELLAALENMISDAVAIAPEGSEITIESLANKGSVSTAHSEYIEAANKEIPVEGGAWADARNGHRQGGKLRGGASPQSCAGGPCRR
jgi:phage gp29-like protein